MAEGFPEKRSCGAEAGAATAPSAERATRAKMRMAASYRTLTT